MPFRTRKNRVCLPVAVVMTWGLLATIWLGGSLATADDATPTSSKTGENSDRPNILFIAIDDLNDWVGCLDGHPLVQTPQIDALAKSGVNFRNAHCQAPLCNSSRTSFLTGLRPSTTGIYGLAPWFRTLPKYSEHKTWPQHFANHGYQTLTTGKIFHDAYPPNAQRRDGTEFETWGHHGRHKLPPEKLVETPDGIRLMDWGVYPESDEEQDDHTIADWAIGALGDLKGSEKPWMLCVGFRRPHVPLFASQEWFDLYPDDDSVLPDILENDRDDTPFFSWYLHWKLPEPRLSWLKRSQQWQPMTRAYLASVSFVDNEVGRVLAALDNSGQRKQTIIVLISDHGYHLGEKEISGKNTLWSESTRVPMIVSGPGIEARQFDQPTELLDVFPTVAELCGVPSRHDTEGLSLAPFLSDPSLVRKQPAITTHNQGNHSIRSERYRLIQYADGAQEFYDCQADPNEWTNLANDPEYATFLAEHTKWIPQVDVDLAAGSKHRTLTYRKLIRKGVELERVTWEDEVVDPALWDR